MTAPTLIEAGPDLLDIPNRISVFGLTRLPASHLPRPEGDIGS